MVVIRIQIESKTDQSEALARIVNEESNNVRKFPGCVFYALFRSTEHPEQFLLYEEWQDRSSFEAYKTSDAFKALGTALGPLLAGAPKSAYYEGDDFFGS